jgi:hypothetical protein
LAPSGRSGPKQVVAIEEFFSAQICSAMNEARPAKVRDGLLRPLVEQRILHYSIQAPHFRRHPQPSIKM